MSILFVVALVSLSRQFSSHNVALIDLFVILLVDAFTVGINIFMEIFVENKSFVLFELNFNKQQSLKQNDFLIILVLQSKQKLFFNHCN